MASLTLRGLNDRFPEGTSLGAYPLSNWTPGQQPAAGTAPVGSATATASVSGDAVTLTGLADDTAYIVTDSSGTKFVRAFTSLNHGQPVKTDSAGRVPSTLLTPSVINVQDTLYGAKGDGTTDDLAAINLAVAALPSTGGAIYFPKGNYLVSARIAVDLSNVTLYGDGPVSKITLQAGSNKTNVIRFNTSTDTNPATVPRLSNVGVRDLRIDCQGGDITWAAGGVPGAVVFYACDGVNAHDSICDNARDHAFNAKACTNVAFDHLTSNGVYSQNASNQIQVTGTSTISAADQAITDCRAFNAISLTLTAATRSGTTATFTTSAPHKMTGGQYIKVTGCTPNDYNGFWNVSGTPTSTTFTATLLTTPSGSASVLGTVRLMADRAIYAGGLNAIRTKVTGNYADHCTAGVTAETGTPAEATEIQINDNTASNFSTFGVGVTTSGTQGLWGHRGQVNDNVVRGLDGTTAFGMAGTGSLTGVQLQGSNLEGNDNTVTNVRQGAYVGLGSWAVNEVNYQIIGGTYLLASDATGQGILVEHTDNTTALRRLKIRDVQVDGQLATTSNGGIVLKGRIVGFDISGDTVRGMGRSGIKLEQASSVQPSAGVIEGNTCVDNANAGSTAINKVGIAIDASVDDVVLGLNKCYDTRGGSALQTHGLYVEAAATNIRSSNDDFAGNLTGEVNDQTVTVGFYRTDYRDPQGLAIAYVIDPRIGGSAGNIGAAGRTVYARVTGGGVLASKIAVQTGTVDSSVAGTTDQIAVAVYANKSGTGRNARPGVRKAVSASTTATASAENQVALTAAVQVNVGDWLAVRCASSTTQLVKYSSGSGPLVTGLQGFDDGASGSPIPPSPAATLTTTTLGVLMVAIP